MRKWLQTGMVVMLCALLVACGSSDPTAPADSTPVSSPTTATPPPVADMQLGDIVWAESTMTESGAPDDVVEQFTTESPAIIAVIEVTGVPAGTQFTATWTLDDQMIDGANMSVTADSDLDHAWVAFRFTRDQSRRYPIGTLGVVITSTEGDLREASVEIAFP